MSFPLILKQGLVAVTAEVMGPNGVVEVEMALDTGASQTSIALSSLLAAGYDPSQAVGQTQMVSGTGQATVPVIIVYRLTALGFDQMLIPVLAHNLPPSAAFRGLLGLDCFENRTLTLDFRTAQITLN